MQIKPTISYLILTDRQDKLNHSFLYNSLHGLKDVANVQSLPVFSFINRHHYFVLLLGTTHLEYIAGSSTSCLICLPPFQRQALKTGHTSSAKVSTALTRRTINFFTSSATPQVVNTSQTNACLSMQQTSISWNFPIFSAELLLGHNYSSFYSYAFDFPILGTELGTFLCRNSSS